MLIETIPGNLSKVPVPTPRGAAGVQAIEIVDGSPRGLSQTRRERARIVHLADSLNLALVSGSDNHGWGRAAPGVDADANSRLARHADGLAVAPHRGRAARRRAAKQRASSSVASPADESESRWRSPAPLVAWRMLTTLSADERVMWFVWTWGIVLLARGLRRYRSRRAATA